VGSTGVVAEQVWAAVDDALERGQHLALSTARGAFAASWQMAKRLDPSGWHVFHAGAVTVHSKTGESRGHSLTASQLTDSIRIANEHQWVLELYSATDYGVEVENELSVGHAELLGMPFVATPLDTFIAEAQEIVRAQFVVPEGDISLVHDALRFVGLSVTSATSPIMPGMAFVSATQAGITKATGISQVCDELGIEIEHVMMIGDGLNDLAAIEAVGHSVAMGNAAPEVIEASRYHVASVDDHGVAEALQLSATL